MPHYIVSLNFFQFIKFLTFSRCRHQHKNTVQALAWSTDGDYLASASRDQTVRVFDIRAMREFKVMRGHKKEVCCKYSLTLV